MLSRVAAPVMNFLVGSEPAPVKPQKSVPELLAELAEVRARKAELERKEAEIVAATRARLLHEQQALEGLKKKVTEHGIEVTADWPLPQAPAAIGAQNGRMANA